MISLQAGTRVRHIATGQIWYVASIFHPNAKQGATVLCQKTQTEGMLGSSEDATCFNITELEECMHQTQQALSIQIETVNDIDFDTFLEVLRSATPEMKQRMWEALKPKGLRRGRPQTDYRLLTEKKCACCQQMLSVANFTLIHNKKTGKTYYNCYCKKCVAVKNKERRYAQAKKTGRTIRTRHARDWSQITEKYCSMCQQTKPVSDFSPNRSKNSNIPYQHYCKRCFSLSRRKKRGTSEDKPYFPQMSTTKTVLETGQKYCYGCQQFKAVEHFHVSISSKDGCHHRCKECNRRYNEERSKIGRTPEWIAQQEMRKALLAAGQKKCGKCQQVKALTEFSPQKTGAGGVGTVCKACKTQWAREHYAQKADHEVKSYVLYGRRSIPDASELSVWTCAHCHEEKPVADFYLQGNKPRGCCKNCQALRQRERRKKRKEAA